jgi:hypothetical protein
VTIPFVEECMSCDLGGAEYYEEFHAGTDEQLVNLRRHCDAVRWAIPVARLDLYIQRLNTGWRGDL